MGDRAATGAEVRLGRTPRFTRFPQHGPDAQAVSSRPSQGIETGSTAQERPHRGLAYPGTARTTARLPVSWDNTALAALHDWTRLI